MRVTGLNFKVFSRIILVAAALSLPACQMFAPPPAPVKKTKKAKTPAKTTQYQSEAYVKHLSLARLSMSNELADYADAAPNIEIMDAYSEQKRTKPDNQAVLIIQYERKSGGGKQTLLAPIKLGEKADTPGLLSIMNALTLNPSMLHDLRVATATVNAEPLGEMSELGSVQIRRALDAKHREVMETGKAPAVLDNVRTQMSLTRFFIANRFRDAAYLSVDNIKKLLASASSSADESAIKQLSAQFEVLETELHKVMPFTLR